MAPMQVNLQLLPVKFHYFFFFAALGPILPQLNVFGRQLGVSPDVMGLVTAVLPLLWAAAKPTFGLIVDYFTSLRKQIFILLIVIMSSSYCGLWFLPEPHIASPYIKTEQMYRMNDTVYLENFQYGNMSPSLRKCECTWEYRNTKFDLYILYIDEKNIYQDRFYVHDKITNTTCATYGMELYKFENKLQCTPEKKSKLVCFHTNHKENVLDKRRVNRTRENETHVTVQFVSDATQENITKTNETNTAAGATSVISIYFTVTFWGFVVFMCVGTVAFNVANCISDAVCFDVLGADRSNLYGNQRAWGTAGYGATAFLGGWLVDAHSTGDRKNFTPAFILVAVFTLLDLGSCQRVKLPRLRSADGGALRAVLRSPRVLVFIAFAVAVGSLDSFIIYYLFWYIEELAEKQGDVANVKLLEGVIIFGQCFVGELVFFFLSGRILYRFGHANTMTFSMFCYALRLALVTAFDNPWYLVPIEAVMQGPTYALCYACIVGYAARVAPEGHSATVQGVVAGMDDGVGFAVGSLLGGQLYKRAGGRGAFCVMSAAALLCTCAHAAVHAFWRDTATAEAAEEPEEVDKMLPLASSPCSAIYGDTVEPRTATV